MARSARAHAPRRPRTCPPPPTRTPPPPPTRTPTAAQKPPRACPAPHHHRAGSAVLRGRRARRRPATGGTQMRYRVSQGAVCVCDPILNGQARGTQQQHSPARARAGAAITSRICGAPLGRRRGGPAAAPGPSTRGSRQAPRALHGTCAADSEERRLTPAQQRKGKRIRRS